MVCWMLHSLLVSVSNLTHISESFQNKFHARCATCKRRLKEKTEMIGIMNGDNIVDFKWNIRLQCICPENPSVICVRENSGVYYDRNALHVGFKLIWHMREGLGPFVLPAYQPPLRLFFSSVNDNINPLLASLAPLASANPLFALLQAKKWTKARECSHSNKTIWFRRKRIVHPAFFPQVVSSLWVTNKL